ncbi:MAG: N-acetylglucosamine-6-phosphate deacetylase [Betaproteobacteria bacterium]
MESTRRQPSGVNADTHVIQSPPAALHGQVLGPGGWVDGHVQWLAGRVTKVEGLPVAQESRSAGAPPLIVPGFIDLHVHGGGGRDTMEGRGAVTAMARVHAKHGTTALLATTMTAPVREIEAALHAVAPQCIERDPQCARVLGVHLEGPYISPDQLGAQPSYAKPATLEEVMRLHAIAPIRVLTLAPEVPGNLALIPPLVAAGIRVQVGHTRATYEEALQALQRGATGFTHLFNAMGPMHHRAPGAVGAALAHAEHAELIPDLLHVHPGAIHAALRAVPGLFAVTDATAAAGMPDGQYPLGQHIVHKCMGGVRLPDGTLAGSALTMDQALRNLVQIGLPVAQACARVSTNAARYLRLHDRGTLAQGSWADMVVLDPATLAVRQVVVEGEVIDVNAQG